MKQTLIILVGLGIAGAIGAYFAKKEMEKLLEELDLFHDRFQAKIFLNFPLIDYQGLTIMRHFLGDWNQCKYQQYVK